MKRIRKAGIDQKINNLNPIGLEDPGDYGFSDCHYEFVDYYERYCYYNTGTGETVFCTEWQYEYTETYLFCNGNSGEFGGGGGQGYIEYDEPEDQFENQDIIDSLRGYPCAQEILKQLTSLDEEVDSLIYKIFGQNPDANLKFSVDSSLNSGSPDGYTKSASQPDGTLFSFIKLNPWVLQNSTKEYILVTLLHESIHSYIDYWYGQYTSGKIDSTTFKTRFPIFWNYHSTLKDSLEIAEHNSMANKFINTMKNAILAYNPNVPDSVAVALAWGGLHQTTVWQTKKDTIQVTNINLISRDVNLNEYSQYKLQKCGDIPVQ